MQMVRASENIPTPCCVAMSARSTVGNVLRRRFEQALLLGPPLAKQVSPTASSPKLLL